MRMILTGATGNLGRLLVPRLAAAGTDLLLVGREPSVLARLYPGIPVCGYDTLRTAGKGADMLVHLAVANNDSAATEVQMQTVNVELALQTFRIAQDAGIRCFVFPSSFHALEAEPRTAYAASKLQAANALMAEVAPSGATRLLILNLPAVHGETRSGRLAILDRLPDRLAQWLFTLLSALRPTLHADRLAAFLLTEAVSHPEMSVLLADGQQGNPAYRILSRSLDLAIALGVLIGLGWLLLPVLVAIRIDSPGPGLFRQTRIGRNRRPFTCLKFRTMWTGTPQAGTHETPVSSVTRLGGFLRRTKLDELPQAWNVLRGEMALVGPRPCLPSQEHLVAARESRGVFRLTPGITGISQTEGLDMSDPDALARRDADYLSLQCLALDLRLLVATISGKGSGDRTKRP